MEKFMYGKRLKEYVYLIGSVINNKMRRMLWIFEEWKSYIWAQSW